MVRMDCPRDSFPPFGHEEKRANERRPETRFSLKRGARRSAIGGQAARPPDVWSVRISAEYRAIGQRKGDEMTWVWIGSHNGFDKLFG